MQRLRQRRHFGRDPPRFVACEAVWPPIAGLAPQKRPRRMLSVL